MSEPRRFLLHNGCGLATRWMVDDDGRETITPDEGLPVREDRITLSDRESAAKVISRARDQEAWERLPQYVKDACRAEADSILSTIFRDGKT